MQIVSYVEWIRIVSGNSETLGSLRPQSNDVENYLAGCGFYSWVGNHKAVAENKTATSDVVKLEKFDGAGRTQATHWKIDDLMKRHSQWSSSEVEKFSDVALSEALINVTEHGLNHRYEGWFVLAQLHPTSKFLSICIGDNGIGVRHSLLTGNQESHIRKLVDPNSSDGDFIRLAMEKQVSGAIDSDDLSSRLFGLAQPKVSKGKRRGRGLKKIVSCCRELGVQFTVVSHRGAVQLSEDGASMHVENRQSNCFAGALYHFKVPIGRKVVP